MTALIRRPLGESDEHRQQRRLQAAWPVNGCAARQRFFGEIYINVQTTKPMWAIFAIN